MVDEQKPVIDGTSTADSCMEPTPAPAAPPKGHHDRPWGMGLEDFARFMTLVAMGMERLDKRQRWVMLKQVRIIRKELNAKWPFGRPIEDIQREIAEQQLKPQIIIPTGVNVDTLKEQGK